MQAKSLIGSFLASSFLVVGCSPIANSSDEQTVESTRAEDQVQWPVVIEDADLPAPAFEVTPTSGDARILALAVGSGEIVELLGAGSQLVGKDETSATPEEVPVVTRAHQIEIEDALALEPTVVLVDDLSGPPEAIDALAGTGARIVQVPSVWTLSDIPERITALAEGVGVDRQTADSLARALTPEVEATTSSPRVAFLYLRGPSAVYLLGGKNTGADALIEASGGVDVGAELGFDGFVPLTAEAIVQADPDVLLVMADGLASVGGVDGLTTLPGIAQTSAGQERRIVVVDDRTLLSFGSRTPALVDRLSRAFAAVA